MILISGIQHHPAQLSLCTASVIYRECVGRAEQPRKDQMTRQETINLESVLTGQTARPLLWLSSCPEQKRAAEGSSTREETQLLLFLCEKGTVQARWGHMLNPQSIALLCWNVELYRKLGHMVQTTGSRVKGNSTIPQVYPRFTLCHFCSAELEMHAHREV